MNDLFFKEEDYYYFIRGADPLGYLYRVRKFEVVKLGCTKWKYNFQFAKKLKKEDVPAEVIQLLIDEKLL